MFRYRAPENWLEVLRTTFGPVQKTYEVLNGSGREHLSRDLLSVIARFNVAEDGTMVAPAAYLEVVAKKC